MDQMMLISLNNKEGTNGLPKVSKLTSKTALIVTVFIKERPILALTERK